MWSETKRVNCLVCNLCFCGFFFVIVLVYRAEDMVSTSSLFFPCHYIDLNIRCACLCFIRILILAWKSDWMTLFFFCALVSYWLIFWFLFVWLHFIFEILGKVTLKNNCLWFNSLDRDYRGAASSCSDVACLLSEKLSWVFVNVFHFFYILDNGSSWDNYHSGKIFFSTIYLQTYIQFRDQHQIYCILEL